MRWRKREFNLSTVGVTRDNILCLVNLNSIYQWSCALHAAAEDWQKNTECVYLHAVEKSEK